MAEWTMRAVATGLVSGVLFVILSWIITILPVGVGSVILVLPVLVPILILPPLTGVIAILITRRWLYNVKDATAVALVTGIVAGGIPAVWTFIVNFHFYADSTYIGFVIISPLLFAFMLVPVLIGGCICGLFVAGKGKKKEQPAGVA